MMSLAKQGRHFKDDASGFMEGQNQQIQPNIPQPQPSLQPEIPKKQGLPTWLVVLIIVSAVIIVGAASYATYRYFAPQTEPNNKELEQTENLLLLGILTNDKIRLEFYTNDNLMLCEGNECIVYIIHLTKDSKKTKTLITPVNDNFWLKLSTEYPSEPYTIIEDYVVVEKIVDFGRIYIFYNYNKNLEENNELTLQVMGAIDDSKIYIKNRHKLSFDPNKNVVQFWKCISDICSTHKDSKYELLSEEYLLDRNEFTFNLDENFGHGNFVYWIGEEERIKETTLEADETADWQTYRNEEYRFEFRYPDDWSETSNNDKWFVSAVLVHNNIINDFKYYDGPSYSIFKAPEVSISLNVITDETIAVLKDKTSKSYDLLCEEKYSKVRQDGILVEFCDFRVYRGEIEDSASKIFCIQRELKRSCLSLLITKPLNELTNNSFKQYSPYINKQIDEQYKNIATGIIDTFEFID